MRHHSQKGKLVRICGWNQLVDFVNVPGSEASYVIEPGKCGEQPVRSQDHIIEIRAAGSRTAVRQLIDQGPGEAEFVFVRRLNSRPGTHSQRRRQTGSPD